MQWGIRPLLYWTGDENESLRRLEFVYPLGKYQVKEGDKKGYLSPLSLFREETLTERRNGIFNSFPFFIGETEKGKDYYGLFPILRDAFRSLWQGGNSFLFLASLQSIHVRRSSYHKPALAFFLLSSKEKRREGIASGPFMATRRNSESPNRNSSYGLSS